MREFDRMSLAILANPEARLLVAAWPLVPRGLKPGRQRREWARLANVREIAIKLYERPLREAGIVRPGGKVADEARELVTADVLRLIARGLRR